MKKFGFTLSLLTRESSSSLYSESVKTLVLLRTDEKSEELSE